MARRTAKKKSAAQADTPKPQKKTAGQPAEATTDGAALLADLEQRCVSLRAWHQQASATLESREAFLDTQGEQLAAQQATLNKTNTQLNEELEQLRLAQAQIEAEHTELAEMRRELDAEWSALRNMRDAQAKLGRELDAERQRLNRRAFKLTTPANASSTKLKAA